jgi:hypothetical protein
MRTLSVVASARSDDNGRYRLFWLGAGEYYVHVEDRRGNPSGDTSTYYPNAAEFETATPVSLQSDSELSTIDIQMRRSPTVPVTVRVVDDRGNARQGSFDFYPLDRTAPLGTPLVVVVISPQSAPTTRISNVRPGAYEVVARVTGSNVPEAGRTSIKVGNSPGEVTVVVRPPVDVSARVVTRNAATDPKEMQFLLEGREVTASQSNPVPGSDFTRTFKFQAQGGRHLPRIFGLENDDYIADVRQDGRSVFNDGLTRYP